MDKGHVSRLGCGSEWRGPMAALVGILLIASQAHAAVGFTIYETNGSSTISKILSTGAVSTFATVAANANPQGLAVDGFNNVYVANANLGTISKITPAGVVSQFAVLPTGANPYGLAFDVAGNLYAGDANLGAVDKITPAGVVSVYATLDNFQPVGVASSGSTLYLADPGGEQLAKLSSGAVLTNIGTGGAPFGLAVDNSGNL